MRQLLLITGSAMLAFGAVFGLFTLQQANQEQITLQARLQSRTQVLADSLAETIEPALAVDATSSVQRIADRFSDNQRLAGLEVFDSSATPIVWSADVPVSPSAKLVPTAMDSDEAQGEFVRDGESTFYVFVSPLHQGDRIIGALVLVQSASYIDDSVWSIWVAGIGRLLAQLVLFGAAVFILLRWVFFKPLSALMVSLRSIRKGEVHPGSVRGAGGFLHPLESEVSKITSSLAQARRSASEEARMRLEKIDTPWTAERLKEFIKAYVKDRPIYALSNREPYVHHTTKNGPAWSMPAGGAVTALDPVLEATGGTWIAHGSGDADKETADKDGKLRVPPDEPRYTLKRIWLTPQEVKGYYNGFSNEALWPLCHMAHVRPVFRKEDWLEYRKVNGLFAKTLLDEIRHVERPLVLVQDYHLALVPALIKKSRPDAQVAIFWHIPWPSAAQFSICPWRAEILEGMLGADLIGLHTQQFCNNFLDTVGSEVESRIDLEHFSIFRAEHRTFVKAFPISIAFPGIAEMKHDTGVNVLKTLGIRAEKLLIGVDRLDYTKGILERFKGFEFLLADHPEYRGAVTMLQIASPTRESVEKYKEYALQVAREAARINERFATRDWNPVVLETRTYSHEELLPLHRRAHVCLVTSLHDGMNLVAKEYVAAHGDESGVLVLSKFTGASRDLKTALIINPYSAENTAEAILTALMMPPSEQRRRMKAMRDAVRDYNVYRWAAELIKALARIE